MSASICCGESFKTFADSVLEGVGEASPPLLLILLFSFPAPFAASDEEPFGRDSVEVRTVFPLLPRSSRPWKSFVAPCSAIGDNAGVASCSFDNEPFNPSMPSPSLCASLMIKYRVT